MCDSALITLEVEYEIHDNEKKVASLAELSVDPLWPARVALTPAQMDELLAVAKEQRRILGGFTKEDSGEISTAIYARDEKGIAVVDDDLGVALCRLWEVRFVKTHRIVAEMTKAALLTEREGWPLWRDCLRQTTREKYSLAVRR